jgi:hypothetical protein
MSRNSKARESLKDLWEEEAQNLEGSGFSVSEELGWPLPQTKGMK